MGHSPKISIITPVYNAEKYLEQCVESVIGQTFSDWELILVNDGSVDASAGICDRYAGKDPRIRVIHKQNTGVADSRNIALKQARGEYLGFVDSDDWIEPDMYQALYNDIVGEDADVAMCGYVYEWNGRTKSRHSDTGIFQTAGHDKILELAYEDSMLQNILCDKLWHRSLATVPMPAGFFYEDFATVVKWLANARKISMRTVPLYHYRMRRGSTVNGVHPERRYHYLLAEIERARFLQSVGFVPENGFAPKIIHTAVTAAKLVARGCDKKSEALKYIDKIRESVIPYVPCEKKYLGRKTYARLRKIIDNPDLFLFTVRFSRLFMFAGRSKERMLFD